jgi:hypothetical protein
MRIEVFFDFVDRLHVCFLQVRFETKQCRSTKMRDYLLSEWVRFRHCDEGVTLVEYGIAIALAVTLGTGALAALATQITTSMGLAGAAMP